MTVLWLTGPTLSGKSTYAEILRAQGIRVLSLGETLKASLSEEELLALKSDRTPSAPSFLDLRALAEVRRFLAKNFDQPLVAVDGFPRTPDQAQKLVRGWGSHSVVMWFNPPDEVEFWSRVKRRGDDPALVRNRVTTEPYHLSQTFRCLKNAEVLVVFVSGDRLPAFVPVVFPQP